MTDDHHEARGAMLHRGMAEARSRDYHAEISAERDSLRERVGLLERRLVSEEASVERLTRERESAREAEQHAYGLAEEYLTAQNAAIIRAEAAERKVEALREALIDARLGIAVLGDTTKHLGLQMGQDAAARIITAIDAALAKTEKP